MRFLNFLSYRSTRIFAYVFGLLVFVVGILLDTFLIDIGASRPMTLLVDDFLTGAAAGVALWLVLRYEQRRRIAEAYRLQVLDETNHHVRNALQVMVLFSHSVGGQQGEQLRKAVDRIQWTLNEVLPQVNFATPRQSPRSEFSYQAVAKPDARDEAS